jgi:transcriptional regulator with XRE-family HTH domain
MDKSLLDEFTNTPEELQLFQQEYLITELTELICRVMAEKKIRRSDLANKLNLTKGRISQILNGEANLKLRTIADIFTVLGKELCVSSQDLLSEKKPLSFVTQATKDWPSISSTWDIPYFSSQIVDSTERMAG